MHGGRSKAKTTQGAALAVVGLPVTPRRIRLGTLEQISVELQRVYREARAGLLDPAVATKLCFMLATLAKLREVGDLEARILELESKTDANP